ncbi:MAG: RHS repeat-associated core domain-containing protein, partial [Planctomycetia bacterium]
LTDQTTKAGNETFTFAANGNRNNGGYATDRDNRLATDPAYVYTYDAEGNRVSRTALAVRDPAQWTVQAVDGSPTTTGGSWNVSAAGYGGSQQVGTGFLSSSAATATWQTPALPAGAYEVYATWAPLSAGLQTERYTLTTSDGSGTLASTTSAPINFRQAPAGLDYDGVQWTRIGGVSSSGIFTATVTLSTGSNWTGEIPADAILVRPVSLEQAKTTYQWDHQNRLTSVTNHSATMAADGSVSFTLADTTTYAYDVLGRRAAVTYDKTDPNDTSGEFHRVSIHDGSQVVWTEQGDNRDQMAASTITQAMLWAPGTDQLLAIQERLGGPGFIKEPVWTLTDQQGTVKDYLAKGTTTGAESGLIVTRRFSAFGTPELAKLWISGPDGNFTDISGKSGFFYVGQEYDATTGLQYSRARYYDPVSSEFISQDPLGFAGGDTNLYRRAGNSPANATDPSGLIINVGTAAAGAGIGAVIGGGFYLVSNYVSGRDFSWSDFAIATASGAVSGAVAGATGGASLLAQAASGAAAGAAGGAVYGGATSYAAGGSLQQVAGNALSGAAVGAVAGLAGGAVTGRLLGANPAAAMLGQRVAANAAGGATGGAIGGGFDGYMHTGTLAHTLEGAATGLVYGGVVAGGLTAGSAAVTAGNAAVRRAFAPVRTVGDTIPAGRRLIVRPVEIEFPATGLSPAQQRAFASHLAEQEARLNQLSLNHTDALKTNLANYPNIKAEVARSRRLARQFLPGYGANMDAAHALDSVAGGYIYDFVGFRSKIQQQIGSLWRTRVDQIVPGKEHRLVPIFRNLDDAN